MGAVLTDRIGCQLATRVSAIVIVAGSEWHSDCDPARPVSVLILHGTSDSTFPVEDARNLAARWRQVDECRGKPKQATIDDLATVLTSTDCARASHVELVTIEGQEHLWFLEPSATQLLWRFLSSVDRRGAID
jgi:polyhydroxybutyrate depolymerase